MSNDTYAQDEMTPPVRLMTAAEQLRLASVALAALAGLVDEQDEVLTPHVERLECRARELMRTAGRLARDMGVAQRWGLDVLFAPASSAPVGRLAGDPNASVELEPLELLSPLEPVSPPPPRVQPAWSPQIMLPTPPLVSMSSSDESHC